MTIAAIADYQAALRETIAFRKTVVGSTGIAGVWLSSWFYTGDPTTGGAVGNTANGVVPTDATTGAPAINFGAGVGYLARGVCNATLAPGRFLLYDRLFHSGAHACSTLYTLAAQPSYASRIDTYVGTQIWVELVNAWTVSPLFTITYTNQSGVAGQTTTYQLGGTRNTNQAYQIPLAAGDSGVQKIESVNTGSGGAGQTFNVIVARPLFLAALDPVGIKDRPASLDLTLLPRVYGDSCLAFFYQYTSGSVPLIEAALEVASL